MPNGHLPVAPDIDDAQPNAPALRWLLMAVPLVYAAVGEVKGELQQLSVWRSLVDARHIADDERARARRELREERSRWWSGLKLRVEVLAALVGAAAAGAGVATVVWRVL